MYCTNCGKEIDDKAVICVHCGVPTDNYSAPAKVKKPEQKTNGLGIAGFAVGLSAIFLGIYLCIPSVAGLVLSIIAVKNKAKCTRCNNLATAGLILSIVSLAIWAAWWFVMIFTNEIAVVY